MDAPDDKRKPSEDSSALPASTLSSSEVLTSGLPSVSSEDSIALTPKVDSVGGSDSSVEALLSSVTAQVYKTSEAPIPEPEKPSIPSETPLESPSSPTSISPDDQTQKVENVSETAEGDLDIDALLKQVQNETPPSSEVEGAGGGVASAEKEEASSKNETESASVSHEDLASILGQVQPVVMQEVAPPVTVAGTSKASEKPVEETDKNVTPPDPKASITQSLEKGKEFDISTDPDVVAMKGRMKEKIQDLLKTFVTYKTFSVAFIIQIPKVISRRRKAKLVIREFSDWIEAEKSKIQKVEDPLKRGILEKGSIAFDQEMQQLRKKGMNWVGQGWRKSFLLLAWMASVVVAFSVGIPSLVRMYVRKPIQKVEVKEMQGAENLPVEEQKKAQGPSSYLLLSCDQSQMGKLGRIRVYDRDGKELANFPPNLNPMKKKILTQIPSGECGVIIETGEYPVVGSLELTPNQRRFIDLSKWTDPAARALIEIQSTPEGIPIICNGAWIGKGFAKVYLIAGVHKIWASLPNFPAQEQHIMVVDDREQTIGVNINMGRFIFKVSEAVKKSNPQLKVMVNGSLVSDLNSHAVLSGYHLVKVMDAGRIIAQQEVKLDAAEEATFQVQRLDDGQLSAAMVSKKSLLGTQ
jgi:hypothetical protein